MNKKLIIILLILVVISLTALVWVVLRAPSTLTPINSGVPGGNGFPVGDLNPPDASSIQPGALTSDGNEESLFTNPSTNSRLQPLTNQLVADFWLSSTTAYFITRRSAEIFSVPLEGGEETASTTVTQPQTGSNLITTPDGIEILVGNKTVFTSPFKSWQFSLTNPNTLLAYTSPTQGAQGTALVVNTKTNAAKRVLGGLNGLSAAMSPDGQNIIYSSIGANGLELNLLNLTNNQVSPLPLRTLAEKCTFDSKNLVYCAVPRSQSFVGYPDTWYRGEVRSSDQIWAANTQTLETKLVFEGLLGNEEFDIIKPLVTSNNKWLIFMTKGNWRAWKFDLQEDLPVASTTTPAP